VPLPPFFKFLHKIFNTASQHYTTQHNSMATTSAADESLPAVKKFTNGFKVYKDPNKNILKVSVKAFYLSN
jgi:hypothetical protein